MIDKVQEFHQRFELPTGEHDVLNGKHNFETFAFRIKFMQEELAEFIKAYGGQDRVKEFDALLDLVYVAQGTALFMGISPEQWHAGMCAVHNANMRKVRALTTSESKRGTTLDVVKPIGWKGPEEQLKQILEESSIMTEQGELDL